MSQAEQISLYFCEGSSDKVYHAQLKEADGGWIVNFQYGRRGSTLATGTKTAAAVAYETAKKAYDKLVKEKMGKGYSTGEDGQVYQGTPGEQRFTGIVPQLLNPITEEEALRLCADGEWGAQEKFDGERRLVERKAGAVTGINRKGLAVALPKFVEEGLAPFAVDLVVDGELLGDRYVIFDLLEFNGENLRGTSFLNRYSKLMDEFLLAGIQGGQIELAPLFVEAKAKRELFERLRKTRKEGLVFKRLKSSPYVAGRPNSGGDQLKFKFVESATLRVASVHASKRSVSVEGCDAAGVWVGLGNVTILPNFDIPKVGAIVEVRYLYAYPNGSLYQPVYLGPRGDQGGEACTTTQLKYKAGTDEEDEVEAAAA
jgi:bifunctional non-homologous end joining protein LigD